MLAGQITACSPAVCDNGSDPDIDVPKLEGLSEIVRTYKITTSGAKSGLCIVGFRNIVGPPRCPSEKKYEIPYSLLGAYLGDELFDQYDATGDTYWEYKWLYDSNVVLSSSAGIYKRPGTNTILASNLPCKFRKYKFKSSVYSYKRMDQTNELVLWKTVDDTNCYPGHCNATIDQYVNKYYQEVIGSGTATWSGSSAGLIDTIEFRYLPVASTNVPGLTVTIVSGGPWKIKVSSAQIVISSMSGTTYSFSGTLSSVATSIASAGGGGLFSATVGSLVDGSVAVVSDLKNFETDYMTRASCATDLPIVLAGDDLAPSSLSQSHFVNTMTDPFSGFPIAYQVPFDATAISSGYADTKDGYLSWLKKPKYPKFPPGYNIYAYLPALASSYQIWYDLQPVYFFGTAPVGGLLDNWSDTAGSTTINWSLNTEDLATPIATTQDTEYVYDSGCNLAYCYPQSSLCVDIGFTCDYPLVAKVCLTSNEISIPNPGKTMTGAVELSGLWVIR